MKNFFIIFLLSISCLLISCGKKEPVTSSSDDKQETSTSGSAALPSPTEPPATEPPVTEPPAAEPPAIEPPVAEPPVVFQDGKYTLSIPAGLGLLTYYNQTDVRWANSFYGGSDTIAKYGCGPTALAMVVSSFTEHKLTPSDMAVWARENNYWANNSGSYHALIPEGLNHFGFTVDSCPEYDAQDIIRSLQEGSIFIALVGAGHFTNEGHFIIIADYWSGAAVRIADPASLDNTQMPWEIDLILNELQSSSTSGGPLWKVSVK